VVRDLACGKRRFNKLHKSPEKIATNILADRLDRLIRHGLVEKYADPDQPGREAYRLTEKGKSLGPVLTAVAHWGLANVEGTSARMEPTFG
jgi:DNA-binding HxlR family transcriptional regulator